MADIARCASPGEESWATSHSAATGDYKSSLFSLFSSGKQPSHDQQDTPPTVPSSPTKEGGVTWADEMQDMDLASDDESVEMPMQKPQPQPAEEAQDSKNSGFFSSLFSRSGSKKDVNTDEENPGPLAERSSDSKYDVDALRVPSMMDQDTDDPESDDEDILKDPYDEIRPMKETFQEEHEDDESTKFGSSRCALGFAPKILFLIGSILFLILSVHDFKRVKDVGVRALPADSLLTIRNETKSELADEDVDPFFATDNVTEIKDERTGGALITSTGTHTWSTATEGTRRRKLQINWYTQYWSALPDDVKESAKLLGYDKQKWDNSESVYTDHLHWHELTPEQQDAAALVFGYTEDTWNAFVDRFLANLPTTTPSVIPAASPVAPPVQAPVTPVTPAPVTAQPVTAAPVTEPPNTAPPVTAAPVTPPVATPVASPPVASPVASPVSAPVSAPVSPMASPVSAPVSGSVASPVSPVASPTSSTVDGSAKGENGDKGIEAGEQGEGGDGKDDGSEGEKDPDGTDKEISAFANAYNVAIDGENPPEPRDETFQALYICASICFLLVGVFDGLYQQLGFHAVMVLAGLFGVISGALTKSDELAFNVCNSVSTHLFLLQTVLLIYSRLLLTYDSGVRRVLSVADGMFLSGALMNVVVSYLRYGGTTVAMAATSVVVGVLWSVAAITYLAITMMFRLRQNKATTGSKTNTSGDTSIQESCNIQPADIDGDCEISLGEPQGQFDRDHC
ncbi:expressed unknown protein [Seminavis robusta]|uniref:Transmembrane protein n=1 Tax=Seminavis robusta TaxID=568900 RepID=A0A9N8DH27_9STRA|nr:expressed unknown protein [Seminavis robusta]|eukprot:Sro139_g065140.1 n/a (740) ;mRNA; r:71160-73500